MNDQEKDQSFTACGGSVVLRINCNLVQAQKQTEIADAFHLFLQTIKAMMRMKPSPTQDGFILSATDSYFRAVEEFPWLNLLGAIYGTWGTHSDNHDINTILTPSFYPNPEFVYGLDNQMLSIPLQDNDAGMGMSVLQHLKLASEYSGLKSLPNIDVYAISRLLIHAEICAVQILANCLMQQKFPHSISVQYGAVETVCKIPVLNLPHQEQMNQLNNQSEQEKMESDTSSASTQDDDANDS